MKILQDAAAYRNERTPVEGPWKVRKYPGFFSISTNESVCNTSIFWFGGEGTYPTVEAAAEAAQRACNDLNRAHAEREAQAKREEDEKRKARIAQIKSDLNAATGSLHASIEPEQRKRIFDAANTQLKAELAELEAQS